MQYQQYLSQNEAAIRMRERDEFNDNELTEDFEEHEPRRSKYQRYDDHTDYAQDC